MSLEKALKMPKIEVMQRLKSMDFKRPFLSHKIPNVMNPIICPAWCNTFVKFLIHFLSQVNLKDDTIEVSMMVLSKTKLSKGQFVRARSLLFLLVSDK